MIKLTVEAVNTLELRDQLILISSMLSNLEIKKEPKTQDVAKTTYRSTKNRANQRWTSDEIQFVKDNYMKMSLKKLAKKLGRENTGIYTLMNQLYKQGYEPKNRRRREQAIATSQNPHKLRPRGLDLGKLWGQH